MSSPNYFVLLIAKFACFALGKEQPEQKSHFLLGALIFERLARIHAEPKKSG